MDYLPKIPGITKKTARYLQWKSLKYLISHDEKRVLPRYFFKHPIRYSLRFLLSCLRKKAHLHRDKDFFFYGCKDTAAFQAKLQDPNCLLIVGFSYCHKPFACPAIRFSSNCIHDPNHPVCQSCFIGKVMHRLPKGKAIPLLIPTIHYIGEKVFEITQQNPTKKILFLITACELTLEMFGNWANMVDVQGIGVRLDGRICNTMKAFELSERGIKPGLTVVLPETQERILNLL